MPCYTAWDAFLEPDTPEYFRAEEEIRAKLRAVIHIVDYYYRAFSFPLPQLPDGVKIDPFRQPKSKKELAIREMICHHFACDGVDFCTLYDVCSLLNEDSQDDRPYLAVIWLCANQMRGNPGKFVPVP
jgi:hypothetical protein